MIIWAVSIALGLAILASVWLAVQLSVSNDDIERWRLRFNRQAIQVKRLEYTLDMVKTRVANVLRDCT